MNADSPPTPLDFDRQTQRIRPTPPPPVTYDPAIEPVPAAALESVLRRDLAKTFSTGLLATDKPTGVVIGVIRGGEQRVFSFGTAKPDSLFEIGSITKTFTGLLLAQMIEQRKVQADTPVRELLPEGVVAKPAGAGITLLDLVTQRSGLPRLPDNFHPAKPDNPYADYLVKDLYEFIGQHGVAKPDKPVFLYSNLGLGLLGQALANRAQIDYPELVQGLVLTPLGMQDTTIALSADQERRFIPAYTAALQPAHSWELVALAGAGALRSTGGDMLKYLEANLHPERVATSASANARSLPAALKRSHVLQADIGPDTRIAYAWLFDTKSGNYWHNGGTGGYTSYAFFNPEADYAAIVLVNVALSQRGSFADDLGRHIAQRLAGQPAVSLAHW
jgi:CubicO group peptidase (beta-lactamase class C family)